MTCLRLAKLGLLFATALLAVAVMAWLLVPPAQSVSGKRIEPASSRTADLESLVSELDVSWNQVWTSAGLTPASRVDELRWARRLSLGLAGTIPSLEEIRQLEMQPAGTRVDWWLDHLLADRRTADHLAERFARALVGTENGPFILFRRRRFVSWLADGIHANRPYDELTKEILDGSGIWTARPAANFTTVTTDIDGTGQPDPIRLAARTSRAFLALRIDCLQCHDDFLGTIRLGNAADPSGGTQLDFHRLAAYFGQVRNSLAGVHDQNDAEAYRYQLLDADLPAAISPGVPYAPECVPTTGDWRERLAGWVTDRRNVQFSRATVNRVWGILFGRPLVSPIDDIPLHGPNPPVLERLAADFANSGYDLHRLIRAIARSAPYWLESGSDDSEIMGRGLDVWARFPTERLRPEQVAGSLIQSTSLTTLDSTAHILLRLIGAGQINDFVSRYGDFGENEFTPRSETVAQRLLLMNGQLLHERVEENGLSAPARIAGLSSEPQQAVEAIFLVTLTRRPNAAERDYFSDRLGTEWNSDRVKAVRDIYWSLLNSAEFGWSH